MRKHSIGLILLAINCASIGCGPTPPPDDTCNNVPDDTGILTCRYETLSGPVCVDLPDWDLTDAETYCQTEAGQYTYSVSSGDTCLYEEGLDGRVDACIVTEPGGDAVIYDVVNSLCVYPGAGYGGTPARGPFCDGY